MVGNKTHILLQISCWIQWWKIFQNRPTAAQLSTYASFNAGRSVYVVTCNWLQFSSVLLLLVPVRWLSGKIISEMILVCRWNVKLCYLSLKLTHNTDVMLNSITVTAQSTGSSYEHRRRRHNRELLNKSSRLVQSCFLVRMLYCATTWNPRWSSYIGCRLRRG